jgi:hypothetical protein
MIIKVILLASMLVGALWLLRGQRRAGRLALTRLAGIALAAGWTIAVLSPDTVTRIANQVGVGRGADLILYVTVVAFLFNTALQQRRARELDTRLVRLTRAHALLEQRLAATETAPAVVEVPRSA